MANDGNLRGLSDLLSEYDLDDGSSNVTMTNLTKKGVKFADTIHTVHEFETDGHKSDVLYFEDTSADMDLTTIGGNPTVFGVPDSPSDDSMEFTTFNQPMESFSNSLPNPLDSPDANATIMLRKVGIPSPLISSPSLHSPSITTVLSSPLFRNISHNLSNAVSTADLVSSPQTPIMNTPRFAFPPTPTPRQLRSTFAHLTPNRRKDFMNLDVYLKDLISFSEKDLEVIHNILPFGFISFNQDFNNLSKFLMVNQMIGSLEVDSAQSLLNNLSENHKFICNSVKDFKNHFGNPVLASECRALQDAAGTGLQYREKFNKLRMSSIYHVTQSFLTQLTESIKTRTFALEESFNQISLDYERMQTWHSRTEQVLNNSREVLAKIDKVLLNLDSSPCDQKLKLLQKKQELIQSIENNQKLIDDFQPQFSLYKSHSAVLYMDPEILKRIFRLSSMIRKSPEATSCSKFLLEFFTDIRNFQYENAPFKKISSINLSPLTCSFVPQDDFIQTPVFELFNISNTDLSTQIEILTKHIQQTKTIIPQSFSKFLHKFLFTVTQAALLAVELAQLCFEFPTSINISKSHEDSVFGTEKAEKTFLSVSVKFSCHLKNIFVLNFDISPRYFFEVPSTRIECLMGEIPPNVEEILSKNQPCFGYLLSVCRALRLKSGK
ncbi:hypothetical protein RCL1_005964 [Eukaryota sp. TZLM3-RCL]